MYWEECCGRLLISIHGLYLLVPFLSTARGWWEEHSRCAHAQSCVHQGNTYPTVTTYLLSFVTPLRPNELTQDWARTSLVAYLMLRAWVSIYRRFYWDWLVTMSALTLSSLKKTNLSFSTLEQKVLKLIVLFYPVCTWPPANIDISTLKLSFLHNWRYSYTLKRLLSGCLLYGNACRLGAHNVYPRPKFEIYDQFLLALQKIFCLICYVTCMLG